MSNDWGIGNAISALMVVLCIAVPLALVGLWQVIKWVHYLISNLQWAG